MSTRRRLTRLDDPKHIPVVDPAGEIAEFLWRGLRGFRHLPQFSAEVLRQVGIIVLGSALVVIAMGFIMGATCGIAAEAIGQAVGTGAIGPIFSSFCTTREIVPFIFGFIVAAKIGGGIVAQIGAMRVTDEVAALDAMGVSSMSFLVSTRMLAAVVTMPLIYLVSLGAAQGGAYIASLVRSGSLSQGSWEQLFYTVTGTTDIIFSVIKGLVISAAVITVALFHGFRVRGGPVEVGTAAARAMSVNLVVVVVINMVMTVLFWGSDPRLPIA